jgi:uncharacterized protein YjbI with pentapeptide repeats
MRRATTVTSLLAAALLLLVLSSILYLPTYVVERDSRDLNNLTESEFLGAKNAIRTTLLQGIGGLLILIGAGVSLRQLYVNRDAQITTYLSHAIDQLGNADINVRIGGIYALGRIAKNSDEDQDAIANILTTYLRKRSPWPPDNSSPFPSNFPIGELPPLRLRAPDAQAALDVLGRGLAGVHIKISSRGVQYQHRLMLNNLDLRRSKLAGTQLSGANLRDTSLDGAAFEAAHLNNAFLVRTSLKDASFTGMSSDLRSIHLESVDLDGVRFYGTNLRHAVLLDVTLTKADIRGAYFRQAKFKNVDFREAQADHDTVWPRRFSPIVAGIPVNTNRRFSSMWLAIKAWIRFNVLYGPFRTSDEANYRN